MNLSSGSLLQGGRYRIERVLGQGGFGITYLGVQVSLGRKVAVKEFFMKGVCERGSDTSHVSVSNSENKNLVSRFKEKFLKEANNIASIEHQNIVSIHDVFEENGTAYYVMEYLEGGSLNDFVKANGALDNNAAVGYIRQVASALQEVHANSLLHLDIKPANIMLNKRGYAVLIDFGISKHYDEGGAQTSSGLTGTSEGYAPLEQYEAASLKTFTPATDIYALGATLYFLLTGERPPKASEVMNLGMPSLPATVSPQLKAAVDAAMQPVVRMRPQSITDFLALLDGEGNVTAAAAVSGETVVPIDEKTQIAEEVAGVKGYTVNGVTFKMIAVEGGDFMMGERKKWFDFFADNEEHLVKVKDFHIAETEVTQELWTAVMGSNPSYFTSDSRLPVEQVSWNDCQEFIKKLNALTGGSFRLPTEAEWEFAARGGNKSKGYKYSGGDDIDDVAWYGGKSGNKTHVVKGKQPNELGIYDMSGNVWEWCSDWYGDYSSSSVIDPKGPSSGSYRVLRGGSWNSYSSNCRCADRSSYAPVGAYYNLGFRLASW